MTISSPSHNALLIITIIITISFSEVGRVITHHQSEQPISSTLSNTTTDIVITGGGGGGLPRHNPNIIDSSSADKNIRDNVNSSNIYAPGASHDHDSDASSSMIVASGAALRANGSSMFVDDTLCSNPPLPELPLSSSVLLSQTLGNQSRSLRYPSLESNIQNVTTPVSAADSIDNIYQVNDQHRYNDNNETI